MSCCGSQRRGTIRPANEASGAPGLLGVVYVGTTALSAIGPATGRSYHFAYRGCRLDVSARDAPALLAIASLRRASESA